MPRRMDAERKGLPLEKVEVALRHHKLDTETGSRDCIERKITLTGALTVEQRQRLLEIANKCPVHRALSQSFQLDCSLTES